MNNYIARDFYDSVYHKVTTTMQTKSKQASGEPAYNNNDNTGQTNSTTQRRTLTNTVLSTYTVLFKVITLYAAVDDGLDGRKRRIALLNQVDFHLEIVSTSSRRCHGGCWTTATSILISIRRGGEEREGEEKTIPVRRKK